MEVWGSSNSMQPARLGAAVLCLVLAALPAILALSPPSNAQTVETSQQLNDRIRALSAAKHAPPPHDYIIGAGDVLSVQVFDVPELTREVRVSQTGTIGIPLVPVRLHVSGLTESQAERKIEEVLIANGLISHPEVSVSVRDKKSKPVTVVGAVGHPMVYQMDRQMTLVEILAEAGGIQNDAADDVIITRPETDPTTGDVSEPPAIGPEDALPTPPSTQNPSPADSSTATFPSAVASPADSASSTPQKPAPSQTTLNSSDPRVDAGAPDPTPPGLTSTITVNLAQILEKGDTSNNIVIQPGDVITVPHAGIVYALGAVSRPGGFLVSNDRSQLTTLKLLSLAGGLDRTAKSSQAVIVRRDSNGQQHQVQVDLKKVLKFEAEDVRLLPSDILYVPKSAAKQTLIRAAELGLAIGTGVIIYRLVP
jgi:polysaccharide biosynthesis/export protein